MQIKCILKRNKFILTIILIGFVIFFSSKYLISICIIHGNSMFPTLRDKSIVIESKNTKNILNGDIVIIKKNNLKMVKRVMGIPGNSLVIKDNYLYVDNIKFDNIYIEDTGMLNTEIVLKENEYIVLGDNRNESIDSRDAEIGIIKKEEIIGKII